MTTPREPTRPNDDALEEPTEGHVALDAATAWRRGETDAPSRGAGEDAMDHQPDPLQGARETLAGLGGAAGAKAAGFIAGGIGQAEDGSSMDEPGPWRRHEEDGAA